MTCLICGKPSERAHVKTRGSGGSDEEWNVMPLCRAHHTAQHQQGIISFSRAHPAVTEFLNRNGWHLANNRLYHEGEDYGSLGKPQNCS